jgi:hypothetical protein
VADANGPLVQAEVTDWQARKADATKVAALVLASAGTRLPDGWSCSLADLSEAVDQVAMERGSMGITAILVVDDLVLVAASSHALQLLLRTVAAYEHKACLTVGEGLGKTAAMVCRPEGAPPLTSYPTLEGAAKDPARAEGGPCLPTGDPRWLRIRKPLERVVAYPYLGVLLDDGLHMGPHLTRVLNTARTRFQAALTLCSGRSLPFFFLNNWLRTRSWPAFLSLAAFVILAPGAEAAFHSIEDEFLRTALGVSGGGAPVTAALAGELGWITRLWSRVLLEAFSLLAAAQASPVAEGVHMVVREAMRSGARTWTTRCTQLLEELGLPGLLDFAPGIGAAPAPKRKLRLKAYRRELGGALRDRDAARWARAVDAQVSTAEVCLLYEHHSGVWEPTGALPRDLTVRVVGTSGPYAAVELPPQNGTDDEGPPVALTSHHASTNWVSLASLHLPPLAFPVRYRSVAGSPLCRDVWIPRPSAALRRGFLLWSQLRVGAATFMASPLHRPGHPRATEGCGVPMCAAGCGAHADTPEEFFAVCPAIDELRTRWLRGRRPGISDVDRGSARGKAVLLHELLSDPSESTRFIDTLHFVRRALRQREALRQPTET